MRFSSGAAHQLRFDKVKEFQDIGQTLNDISRETQLRSDRSML
jgi:hypothetical protein